MSSILIIGSGGREAAIGWKLREEGVKVYVTPGNGGEAEDEALPDLQSCPSTLVSTCHSLNINMIVVGPEAPLCDGIVDKVLETQSSITDKPKISIFGPSKAAARIEGSKIFSKEFMTRHGLPTADYSVFTTVDEAKQFIDQQSWSGFVVKVDGLAAGKGVVVTIDRDEAVAAVKSMLEGEFGSAGERVLVEQLLEGSEISALCFTDGVTVRRMPLARDHKRLCEGDRGPNTGGMGVFAPVDVEDRINEQIDRILEGAVRGMAKDGFPFRGVLYAGLMISPTGEANLLEFNARFGDPETEVLLPLLDSPLSPILFACANGGLEKVPISWKSSLSCVGIILAGGEYPKKSDKGTIISNISASTKDQIVFHCGTKRDGNNVVTNGGRILCVSALGADIDQARAKAITVADTVTFAGKQFRRDIGVTRTAVNGGMTYANSGVDVTTGNEFVDGIKGLVKRTMRAGTGEIGGFGALVDLEKAGFVNKPQLVVGIDGVGTKIEVCDAVGDYRNVGFDVVGMCVNDVLCHCAEPLAFLDYYVCGRLDKQKATQVVASITDACIKSGCSLIGGETAEMPGVYGPKQWDVAGCAIGVREAQWPQMPEQSRLRPGDVVVGVASNGAHSNGFSLIRKIVERYDIDYGTTTPWNDNLTFGEALLAPTRIYVPSVLPLMKDGLIKAAAHITGGGITENAIRVLDTAGDLAIDVDLQTWRLPELFQFLSARGPVSAKEMLRTFNCGVGMCLVVGEKDANSVVQRLLDHGEKAWKMGQLVHRELSSPLISYSGLDNFAPTPMAAPNRKKCRVAILISGTGSNMKALVDASKDSDSHAEVVVVISNRSDAGGLELARSLGVPNVLCIPHTKDRITGDMKIHEVLQSLQIDMICLAGFMRILCNDFVSLWKEQILNIHPSILPAFKGAHAVEDALAAGVKVTGCTVHYVETEVDSGRIIAQRAVDIPDGATAQELHSIIQANEHRLFPLAMKKVAKEMTSL